MDVEDKPAYCSACKKLGHNYLECNPHHARPQAVKKMDKPQKREWVKVIENKLTGNALRLQSERKQNGAVDKVKSVVVDCTQQPCLEKINPESSNRAKPNALGMEQGCSSLQAFGDITEPSITLQGGGWLGGTSIPEVVQKLGAIVTAAPHRIEEVRIPIIINFPNEQDQGVGLDAPPIGGDSGGGEIILLPMPKAPSTSDLQRLQLIPTESETDNQQYDGIYGSSEWEEETDSAAYMEILTKSKHKPRKSKSKNVQVPTSSRKLISYKHMNSR